MNADVLGVIFCHLDEESTYNFSLVSSLCNEIAFRLTPKNYLQSAHQVYVLEIFRNMQEHWIKDAFLVACEGGRVLLAKKLISHLFKPVFLWNHGAVLSLRKNSTVIVEHLTNLV